MRKVIVIIVWLSAVMFTAATHPEAAEEKASEQIKKAYTAIHDLQGNFTQTSVIKELEQTQTASGSFAIRRPDRVRWDYVKPEKQTAILVGQEIKVKRAGSEEIIKGRFDTASYGQTPIALLSGIGDMDRDFVVKEDTPAFVLLEPKSSMGVIRSIRLDVKDAAFPIKSLLLVDLYGNRNELLFSDVKLNKGLKDSLFVP